MSTLVADECWDQKSLAEKPHEWVSKVVAIVREMDQRVAAVVSGHDLPSSVSSRLFRHATMFLMEELVDGISRCVVGSAAAPLPCQILTPTPAYPPAQCEKVQRVRAKPHGHGPADAGGRPQPHTERVRRS